MSCSQAPNSEIAEFQGLYGAFHVSELLLQKIWLRRQFDERRACTTAGERVEVKFPGSWNRLGGPDFRGARLVLGGREVTGDVEVHFDRIGWRQHGHDRDPAYAQVVLHVVLFPPRSDAAPAVTSDGREVPTLVLLDLLWHDLEEYAQDEAVAALSGRDPTPLVEELLGLGVDERRARIRRAMEERWAEKTRFARLRIERLGWEDACHHSALEILGYRRNRAPMLQVAGAHSLASFRETAAVDAAYASVPAERWSTAGVRPANHPRRRLEQYGAWVAAVPDWPMRLRDWHLSSPAEAESDVAGERRRLRIAAVRDGFAERLFGGACGASRAHTLAIDLALPYLAVASGIPGTCFRYWAAWYPGDMPDNLVAAARQILPRDPGNPLANGVLQGLLRLMLLGAARDVRAD
jgi:hypothetical protein